METNTTIFYQGEAIAAQMVGETGGYMGKLLGRERKGYDELWRDEEGLYYLRSVRHEGDIRLDASEEQRQAARYFEAVHQINVNAAILWAISLHGSAAIDLRVDAAYLLMEGRSYFDPQRDAKELQAPSAPPVSREDGGHCATYRFVRKGRQCESRVALNAEQTKRLSEFAARHFGMGLEEFIPLYLAGLPNEQKHLEESLPDGPLPSLAFVDEQTIRRLQRIARFRGLSFGEYVQEALEGEFECYECDMLFHPQTGEIIGDRSDEEFSALKRDLRPLDDNNDEEENEEAGQSSDDALFTVQQSSAQAFAPEALRLPWHGPIHATLDLPPTEERPGGRFTLAYDAEKANQVRSLASAFGLPLEAFILKLLARELPGQPQQTRGSLAKGLESKHVAFACFEPAMRRRIEAVAAYNRQTVDQFVASAVGGHVDAHEQDAIAHPTTGELLIEEGALRPDPNPFLPPLGDGQPRQPFFWEKDEQPVAAKRRVESVPLSENAARVLDQLCARYHLQAHDVLQSLVESDLSDACEDVRLAPTYAQEARYLAKHGKLTGDRWQETSLPAPEDLPERSERAVSVSSVIHPSSPVAALPSLLSLLDAESAALVRRYLMVTPYDYTASDIVGGCVRFALEQAFDNQQEAEEMTGLDSEEYHHGSWGYVEADIVAAQERRKESEEEPKREAEKVKQGRQRLDFSAWLTPRQSDLVSCIGRWEGAELPRGERVLQIRFDEESFPTLRFGDREIELVKRSKATREDAAQPVYADNAEASGLVEAEAMEEMQAVAAAVRQVAPEQRSAFGEKLRSALGRIVKRLKGEQTQG